MEINYKDWSPNITDNTIFLSDAEKINNYPFVKLKYLLECKKQMDGLKHKKVVKLIETFLEKQK